MQISIIIPALNEEGTVGEVIREIYNRSTGSVHEIIVADGGSSDSTREEAERAGAVVIRSPHKGRAVQMNAGAEHASGPVLFFLHADTTPPHNFDQKILREVKKGFASGCFRLGFDSDHPLLRFYAWCTRFDINAFRFGDQSLFIKKELFEELGGFNSNLMVMEDNVMVRTIKKRNTFKIIDSEVMTSARKYERAGVLRLQLIFILIYILFFLGFSQETLVSTLKYFLSK